MLTHTAERFQSRPKYMYYCNSSGKRLLPEENVFYHGKLNESVHKYATLTDSQK